MSLNTFGLTGSAAQALEYIDLLAATCCTISYMCTSSSLCNVQIFLAANGATGTNKLCKADVEEKAESVNSVKNVNWRQCSKRDAS